MITHKFREVMAFADDVTVLRRGKLAGRAGRRARRRTPWREMMVGQRETRSRRAERDQRRRAGRCCRSRALDGADDAGRHRRRRRRRSTSAPARSSASPASPATASASWSRCWPASARPRRRACSSTASPTRATRAEMRRHRMSLPARGAAAQRLRRRACAVAENMALPRLRPSRRFADGGWWLKRAALREHAARADRAATTSRPARPDAPIATLSGGNVQRAVLARELAGEVDLLIVANPCFGLDFAAVAEIRARDHRGAQPRRRGAAGQRGPRRDPGALRPHRRHVRRRIRPRGARQ